MRFDTVELPAGALAGVAEKRPVGDLVDKYLQVYGYAAGTYQLEESITGNEAVATQWKQVGADITADGFVEIPHTVAWLRVRTTVPAGGPVPTFLVAARNSRTDV